MSTRSKPKRKRGPFRPCRRRPALIPHAADKDSRYGICGIPLVSGATYLELARYDSLESSIESLERALLGVGCAGCKTNMQKRAARLTAKIVRRDAAAENAAKRAQAIAYIRAARATQPKTNGRRSRSRNSVLADPASPRFAGAGIDPATAALAARDAARAQAKAKAKARRIARDTGLIVEDNAKAARKPRGNAKHA